MSRITTFEELQELGIASIHEQTHISRAKLTLLFDKSFDEITRMQFMGFLSILEREYALDLTPLREEYDAHHAVKIEESSILETPSVVLHPSKDPRKYWIFGAVGAVVLLILIGFMTQKEVSVAPKEETLNLSTTVPETDTLPADKPIAATSVAETNSTVTPETNSSIGSEEGALSNFGKVTMIKPTYKVWVGMINVATGEKAQKITKDPIALDGTKNWLILFGHGRLEMISPQGSTKLNEGDKVWFSYQNGVLQQISAEAFNAKNHGSNW
jgi:hypothetical protein